MGMFEFRQTRGRRLILDPATGQPVRLTGHWHEHGDHERL